MLYCLLLQDETMVLGQCGLVPDIWHCCSTSVCNFSGSILPAHHHADSFDAWCHHLVALPTFQRESATEHTGLLQPPPHLDLRTGICHNTVQ